MYFVNGEFGRRNTQLPQRPPLFNGFGGCGGLSLVNISETYLINILIVFSLCFHYTHDSVIRLIRVVIVVINSFFD